MKNYNKLLTTWVSAIFLLGIGFQCDSEAAVTAAEIDRPPTDITPLPEPDQEDEKEPAAVPVVHVTILSGDGGDYTFLDNSDVTDSDKDPTLTLEQGKRYIFQLTDDIYVNHPLRFQTAGELDLLSMAGPGTLEADEEIEWMEDLVNYRVQFIVTESLASQIGRYRCSPHATMSGSINVSE